MASPICAELKGKLECANFERVILLLEDQKDDDAEFNGDKPLPPNSVVTRRTKKGLFSRL